MMSPIQRWSAPLPPVDLREMLRYAACRAPDEAVTALAKESAAEGEKVLRPALCWREVPLRVEEDTVDMGFAVFPSKKLAAALAGCERAVVFAATVGLDLDRLIARYGRLSPARGLMMQALGAERIEALCDAFCAWLAEEYAPLALRPRFSPGYGDLPLDGQRALFTALDCHKEIGLYLNESLLMSPTKSVTAIVGIGGAESDCAPKGCTACDNAACEMRRVEHNEQ